MALPQEGVTYLISSARPATRQIRQLRKKMSGGDFFPDLAKGFGDYFKQNIFLVDFKQNLLKKSNKI